MNIDLDAIQARVDAATEGPWEVDRGVTADCVYSPSGPVTWDDHGGEVFKAADADFIANARTDVPALLALVREQEARIERALVLADSSPNTFLGRAIRAALTATEGA